MSARRSCLLALALAACGVEGHDEPQPAVENVAVFTNDSREGACLAAVGEQVEDATLQVVSDSAQEMTVAAYPGRALWHCRTGRDGAVAEVALFSAGRQ